MSHTPNIILVADDDLDDQELLEEAFLQLDGQASIHTVSGGRELVEYLLNCGKNALPCLIVLDYNMPGMNGAQVLDFLCNNELYASIPAVVWSTSNSTLHQNECEGKGAKHYFQKPNDYEQVKEMARRMLAFCSSKVVQ